MEFFEVIRKRRACREYTKEPVPPELVQKLIHAGNRAPTACNLPRRRLIVVDDPRAIRSIRQISPSIRADPPLFIIVATDLRREDGETNPLAERSSHIDSGAAGENITLAATALGLASQFTMVPFMSGIREILHLPEHYRVDLVIPIGYSEGRQKSVKPQANANTVYYNRYGEIYDIKQ